MTAAINLFHILVVVPLLFLAYRKRNEIPVLAYKIALVFLVLTLLGHIYMYMNLTTENKWKDWIYMLHILVVFPVLIYLCWLGVHSPPPPARKWFELALVLAFAALGYHTFNLIRYA